MNWLDSVLGAVVVAVVAYAVLLLALGMYDNDRPDTATSPPEMRKAVRRHASRLAARLALIVGLAFLVWRTLFM